MVVVDEHVAVELVAEVAVVLHASHLVEVAYRRSVCVVDELLFAALVAHTSLDVEVGSDVPLDRAAELIAVALRDRSLTVEHPVRVAELLQLGVGPVLYVAAACGVVNLVVVLVVVPVDAARSEVYACKRVPEVAGSSLVLRVLGAVLS